VYIYIYMKAIFIALIKIIILVPRVINILHHMNNSDFIGELKELLAASYSSEMCTVKDHQKCDLRRCDKMPLWDGLDQRRCGRFCWSNRPQSAGKICRN
jgi:hypothetical protein